MSHRRWHKPMSAGRGHVAWALGSADVGRRLVPGFHGAHGRMVGRYRCLAFDIGQCPMPMSHRRWHGPMSAGRGHVAMSPGMGLGAGLCRCRLGAWACRPAYARKAQPMSPGRWACRLGHARDRLGAGHVAWPMRARLCRRRMGACALPTSPRRWALPTSHVAWELGMSPGRCAQGTADAARAGRVGAANGGRASAGTRLRLVTCHLA